MSLSALAARDGNAPSSGDEKRAPAGEAVECARRYPEWLLQHRQDTCFTLNDFLLSKEIGSGKFGA